jgi:hypothetical protein
MIKVLVVLGFYLIIGLVLWGLKKFSKRYLDPFFIIVMLLGILFMIQPLSVQVYTIGFAVLLTGLAGYFISSHLPK